MNSGGRYNPVSNSWTAITTNGAPPGRRNHTAVWTGSEMIVWGGYNGSDLSDGGRYNPVENRWTAVTTNSAPTKRDFSTAVWTGSEMIVWGGSFNDGSDHFLNDGGRYHPSRNSWTAVTTNGTPLGRRLHRAVWTGSEMVVWGGYNGNNINDGGRYNPVANSWTSTATNGAPPGRSWHAQAWTGGELILWGGINGNYLTDTWSYTPRGSYLAVTWSNTDPARRLHWTTNLFSVPVSWTDVPPPYATNATDCLFTEPSPTVNKFYQLHQP